MENKWSDETAAGFAARCAPRWGEDLAARVYSAVLIGSEESLVLHGGGNASVKTLHKDIFGRSRRAMYVKASGFHMASIEPEGFIRLDLEHLERLRGLDRLSEGEMLFELQTHRLDLLPTTPSIETLVHAFLPGKFIDHTHPDAVLALTNRKDGFQHARDALGGGVIVLEYAEPGFPLARAAAAALEKQPDARAMVWIYHGLVTWGDTARESYERTVGIITLAERYLAGARRPRAVTSETPISAARDRFLRVAPIVRGLLARPSGDEDRPCHHVILQPLISREVLDFVDSDGSRELALSPPLTCDHLIRTKPVPLWLENPPFGDDRAFRAAFAEAVRRFQADYDAYVARHAARMPQCVSKLDSMPRVLLLPGLGAICAGSDVRAAAIARDITAHTLAVKAQIAAMGDYAGMPEGDMFDMEYRGMQHAKLGNDAGRPLSRQVALVTGGAGAIGSAIVEILLEQGCHVALTDLPGDPLSCAREDMGGRYGQRFIAVPLDVTDPASVARGFQKVVGTWGGVDIVVVNAGLALVSSLEEMNVEAFRRLEQVNVEGTLLVLAEAARHFRRQNTGGDIVAISTKNVFAPGAGFGAYSATKSAAHQLARIAGLELAEIDVRVNMVSPDAVFSHKDRPSGLWKEVGPSRMAARGLDPQGLEDYYRQRNLLKARVRAEHVARAVLFFVTRQTPTTGATLPVDGGLPDSTPR